MLWRSQRSERIQPIPRSPTESTKPTPCVAFVDWIGMVALPLMTDSTKPTSCVAFVDWIRGAGGRRASGAGGQVIGTTSTRPSLPTCTSHVPPSACTPRQRSP